MATINGKITAAGEAKFAREQGNLEAFNLISYFKIGEGGWEDLGAGRVPRTPDTALSDLDCIVNPSRYPANEVFAFQKTLVGGNFAFESPRTLAVTCTLDATEANDDGFGNNPQFWELGLYDAANVLLAYFTFPGETKGPGGPLTNTVRLVFRGV